MLTNALLAFALLQAGGPSGSTPGQISILDKEGQPQAAMPLEKTSVRAEATGMAARVTLVQTFTNPSTTPIEAIYTFPMSEKAAVDRMRIRIGDRIIEGEIKRREEARRIYEAAKAAGQTASLLDQERPNIFTQSLANVMPGAKIEVEISYVEVLDYEDGQFEFSFPMVVGPRFIPGGVDDPDKISPPVAPEGTRSGAGIELSLAIKSDGPLQTVESVLHAVRVDRQTNGATVSLSRRDEIPNRDFICRWRPSGDGVQTGFYAQGDPQGTGGTFCVVFMPPKQPAQDVIRPKEVTFVMDQSGSQRGFPLDKSRELAKKMIQQLNRQDTFNVISFSDQPRQLWASPQMADGEAIREATNYLDGLEANGGTMMLPAVRMAYKDAPESGRLKIVVFNTDGFIGNETEVLKEVQARNGQARMFTFGIGNGVNRYLIESMSLEGRGDAEIVTLAESADPAVERFIKRMRNPVLTDISIKTEGGLSKITPEFTPDVFGSKPVVILGRYERPGRAKLVLSGKLGGQAWSKTMDVTLPARGQDSSALPVLWARQQVADIARQAYGADPEQTKAFNEQIAQLGLAYGIMTSQTSFVAVEKRVVNIGGKQRTVEVPVDMTDGVSHEGVFGSFQRGNTFAGSRPASVKSAGGGGGGGGFDLGLMRMGNSSPADKISKKLNDKEGKLELMIRVDEITPELLEALKKAGFTLAEQDKGLKVVFGEADAEKLLEIAKIEQVLAIDPLG